ncbi:DUF5804 family protein [Halosimplex pelagicum]|uniref:Uncharacterized protein n=1 Tax=Halosimplex pelagicum TaxID=869886 RepID=A0A7D5TIN1_9EURY|nr:DUF5804 family protein [Halosimplex pelagicum]QLH84056.1 hypothetical protein HZS54_21515 [Halosimplex pelagicum]
MTRVCLVGSDDVNLRYELLSRETARDALATYDLREPFENSVGLETVSLGAAVALLNDLNWYLVRFADEAMVLEPSVSETEWLSRDLAAAVRDDAVDPDEVARFCKIYGLEPVSADDGADRDGEDGDPGPDGDSETGADGEPGGGVGGDPADRKRLVEPMYVTRTGGDVPDYDLRDVEETVVERVTESEFGA